MSPTTRTAVGHYLQLLARGKTPNRRLTKAAWREADGYLLDGEARDRRWLADQLQAAQRLRERAVDDLCGPERYGRDVTKQVFVPRYEDLPTAPENGLEFVALVTTDGEREPGYYLWHYEAWVRLSSALLRSLDEGELRVAVSRALQYQGEGLHIDLRDCSFVNQTDAQFWNSTGGARKPIPTL